MQFAWDEAKSKLNQRKHGISFELAQHVFEDPHLLSWLDNRFQADQEERWIGLGGINHSLVVVVIHTFRSSSDGQEIIRIISARKASKKEQSVYFSYRK